MGLSGVEPLTSRLSGVRSNHLSYRPYCPSLPIAPRPLLGPKLLVLFVVELVVQIVVFVEVVQLLLVKLVLLQLVVEVLVQVLVLSKSSNSSSSRLSLRRLSDQSDVSRDNIVI